MSGGTDPRGTVDCEPRVTVAGWERLAGVQPHPHLDLHAFGPGMRQQGQLPFDRREERVACICKRDEEGVTLGIDLVAVMRLESRP